MIQAEQTAHFLKEFAILKKENELLRSRVKELEEKLSKYENPKNSGNSSIAPSQDPFRKTKSLRKKSKKAQGGQKGHKGSQLKKVDMLDKMIPYDVENCDCCGKSLENSSFEYESRQVFDLPQIKMAVTEHRILKRTCNGCGKISKGIYPQGVRNSTQYGNRLKSLCVSSKLSDATL